MLSFNPRLSVVNRHDAYSEWNGCIPVLVRGPAILKESIYVSAGGSILGVLIDQCPHVHGAGDGHRARRVARVGAAIHLCTAIPPATFARLRGCQTGR